MDSGPCQTKSLSLFSYKASSQIPDRFFSHRRCSYKRKCSYKFRKISLENTCARVSATGQACNIIKKETLAQLFSYEFCEISKNIFSIEHLQTTASGLNAIILSNIQSEWAIVDILCQFSVMLPSLHISSGNETPDPTLLDKI